MFAIRKESITWTNAERGALLFIVYLRHPYHVNAISPSSTSNEMVSVFVG
jgi:hypothetical protein